MPKENPVQNAVKTADAAVTEAAVIIEEKSDDFSKTSSAATLSGAYHQTAGSVKRLVGEAIGDTSLEVAGHEQQLRGKTHRLVGKVRGVREAAVKKFKDSRNDGIDLARKHGGRLLDMASDLADDIKKTVLK